MIDFVTSMPAPAPERTVRKLPPVWITVGVMVAVALAVYLPNALRAQFLDFDDNLYFGPDNPEFREGLLAVLDPRRTIANVYLPVAHGSLWLDGWLGGGAPLLPHATALLFHALGGAVFCRLLLRLSVPGLVAHLGAALFVAHPALAESVAWVSGRKDVLSGLFVFAALLQTAKYCERPSTGRWLGIGGLGALAMYAKATAVVQPLLALLVAFAVPDARARWRPALVLLLVTAPIAWHHQYLAAAEGTLAAAPVAERLGQVPGAYLHYLSTACWPKHLDVLYPEGPTLEGFRSRLAVGVVVLALAAGAGLLAWWRHGWRTFAVGVALFLVALLPFNTAFPASSIAAADRYLYLAVPGLVLALAAPTAVGPRAARAGAALFALFLLPAAWWCSHRAADFEDSATLWRSSLARDEDNAVAHYNLAFALLAKPPSEVAVVRGHLEAAIRTAREPVHEVRARSLLVQLQLQVADYAGAAANARAAIAAAEAAVAREVTPQRRKEAGALVLRARLAAFEPLRLAHDEAGAAANEAAVRSAFPDHPEVIAFEISKELEGVVAELAAAAAAGKPGVLAEDDPRGKAADERIAAALAAHPDHPQLLVARAAWELVRGRVLPALAAYRKAQAADPQCVDAWLGAARLLREREHYADALQYAQGGLRHRPDPALRQEQALALVGLGRLDEAIAHLVAYLKVRPDDSDAAKVLSNVLVGRAYARLSEPGGSHEEAQKLVEQALSYNPKEPRAHVVLGRIARDKLRYAKAVQHFEAAHRQMPDFEDARQLLTESLSQLGYERMFAKDDEAAADTWLRCLEVAPKDFAVDGIRLQLQRIWRKHEESGVDKWKAGDPVGAAAEFRRCLQLDPSQHWAAWLLASTLRDQPGVDLAELEGLCRKAVAWQQSHGLDRSQQVWLLATTLRRRGHEDQAKVLVTDYLAAPDADAKPQVVKALQGIVGN